MNADALTWREPLVALDAAAGLPPAVDLTQTRLTSFAAATVSLLDELTSGSVPTVRLTEQLRGLGDLAYAHSLAFPHELPGAEASALAIELNSSGMRPNEVTERIRYDEFFGIRRVAGLKPGPLANAIFVTFAHAMHDLADTQLGLHELIALLRGAVGATAWIGQVDTRPAEKFVPATAPGALARFRLGHVVFAVMCNFGAHHIRNAIGPDHLADPSRLAAAAQFVRASTAAMWYSAGFPQESYASVVRPRMDAASTKDHGFSGLDNFDFRRMREGWEDLAAMLAERMPNLPPQARESVRRLFEIIVEDNEHHILIAANMVGMLPSLKYERLATVPGISGIPAVSALRLNADERRTLIENLFRE